MVGSLAPNSADENIIEEREDTRKVSDALSEKLEKRSS